MSPAASCRSTRSPLKRQPPCTPKLTSVRSWRLGSGSCCWGNQRWARAAPCSRSSVARGLHGWMVVSPKKDQPTPPREAFDELFANQRVVLLLEDLNDFAAASVDLPAFCGPNGLGRARVWAVAATCRDGPELGAVKEAQGRISCLVGKEALKAEILGP